MQKPRNLATALPRHHTHPGAIAFAGWVVAALRSAQRRREMQRGLHRLLDQPHLARDVGLRTDQIRGALIRLRHDG